MRYMTAIAALFLLASCIPGSSTPTFDPAEGARSFTLSVDNEPAERSGGGFTYRTEEFDLDVVLHQQHVEMNLVNNTDATLRLEPDNSAFVLPDGSSSNVVTGSVSWPTRNDPQPNIVIPAGAVANKSLIPRTQLYLDGGVRVEPMFEWPLTSGVSIRLLLSMEIEGETTEVELRFEGEPEEG